VVEPVPNDRLHSFQADFSFLVGTDFADPDHAASLGAGGLLIEDEFDHLAAPKVKTSAQPKAFFRGIEDEAGKSFWLAVQIYDQTGACVSWTPHASSDGLWREEN